MSGAEGEIRPGPIGVGPAFIGGTTRAPVPFDVASTKSNCRKHLIVAVLKQNGTEKVERTSER